LTIVPWSRHRVPNADGPPPIRTNRAKRESQIAGNPAQLLPFPAKSITPLAAFRQLPQRSRDSSRATKDCFEAVKRDFDPSLVLTHWHGDAHQDHRLVAELTHNTFRDHLVLEYEIAKYDGDLGNPAFLYP